MAISEYLSDSGEKLYKVSVVRKSKRNIKIRVHKQILGIKKKSQALKQEKKFGELASYELKEKEYQGCLWGKLVEDYEKALYSGEELSRVVTKATQDDYSQILRLYTKLWWKRPVRSISKSDVISVLKLAIDKGRSQSRVKKVKNVISGAFKFGLETGRLTEISVNPAIGVSFGKSREYKQEVLTLKEIRLLLDSSKALNHPWFPVWAFALYTGMRNGEIYALKWGDIDLESKRISVSKSYDCKTRKIKSTKTGSWRDVPINDELSLIIKQLRSMNEGSFVLPRLPGWSKGEQARELRKYCLSIGITQIRFHDLRACFATQLLRNHTALVVVMKICGWKDLKTVKHYLRLAGVEIEGMTSSLNFLSPQIASDKVVELFS